MKKGIYSYIKINIYYTLSIVFLILVISGCAYKTDTSLLDELKPANSKNYTETTLKFEEFSVSETVDEVVSKAILDFNCDIFSKNYEVFGEGHIIMSTKEDNDLITIYMLTIYGAYQFQDGNFVKNSGTGAIPVVIRLLKEDNGILKLQDYQIPQDGSFYLKSIKTIFPEELWERCIYTKDSDYKELKRQEQAYAQAYLKAIGRKAEIGDYSDFSHTILTDIEVSVEVSNKIDEFRKYDEGLLTYAPFWIGKVEQVEDGIRYIYEQRFDKQKQEIIFLKIVYDTQEIIEQIIFDSNTGEQKNDM